MENHHATTQKRVLRIVLAVAALTAIIAIPLIVLDDLRYNLALESGLAPGKDAEQLADGDSGAMLIVVPLEYADSTAINPWLYRAQYIAWPGDNGMSLENLETGERAELPITVVDFWSANADGSIVLLRGPLADGSGDGAVSIDYASMAVVQLPTAESVPDSPGDWETASWEKTTGICSRLSVERRYVGCFTRSDTSSYLAGDWQFDVQMWADYLQVEPIYRGQGFIPWVGFAHNDTAVYLQNERGIFRITIPDHVRDQASDGIPYQAPVGTPVASPVS